MIINPTKGALKGTIHVPGDKSISHRAVMLGALAEGKSRIKGFLSGGDCLSTISCMKKMGANIEISGDEVEVTGAGLWGLCAPTDVLYAGNSGTTARLMSGILAGQGFDSVITGDKSLSRRPMNRVITPLSMMGAAISSNDGCCPLHISGKPLKGIIYSTPVASAQLKSAILLAGLFADGETRVTEPALSRNHTEVMLKSMGAKILTSANTTKVAPSGKLSAVDMQIPGDISSAAYFLAAGLIVPHSEITIKNVGINPTRTGILNVISKMGGRFTLSNVKNEGEPVADVTVYASSLSGVEIGGEFIPRLIDEIPVVAVLAAFASGKTVIKDAQELKVKETDRISTIVTQLSAAGVNITATPDGMIIEGGRPICGCTFDSCGDHRISMACAVLALMADSPSEILGHESANISFPGFFRILDELKK